MNFRAALVLLSLVIAGYAAKDPGYIDNEQAQRHAVAMEWSDAISRAEQSIRDWMKANHGEEQFSTRRYYSFRQYSSGSDQRYLVVVTGLKPARGNYWSIDFVVVRDRPRAKPIIYHFGDGADRYIDKVFPKPDGIMVDYHYREQGEDRPLSPGRSIFLFDRDSLQEVVMGPETVWEETTFYKTMHPGPYAADADGIYIAQPGDSILNIAREFNLRVEEIAVLNPEVNWEELPTGTKIRVRKGAHK